MHATRKVASRRFGPFIAGDRPQGGAARPLLQWRCAREPWDGGSTDPAPESWRIVVFTNMPGGMIYSLVDEVVRPLGHRVVGVVTSPGPKRRRSPTYLEVVAAVSPGVDVIVSNHPERWAAMLAPLRPDLIVSGGFPWRIPADVLALPRLGAINFHDALLPGTAARTRPGGPSASVTPKRA